MAGTLRSASSTIDSNWSSIRSTRLSTKCPSSVLTILKASAIRESIVQAFDLLPTATKLSYAAYLQGEQLSSVAAQLGMEPRSVQRHFHRLHQHFRDLLRRMHLDRE